MVGRFKSSSVLCELSLPTYVVHGYMGSINTTTFTHVLQHYYLTVVDSVSEIFYALGSL